MTQIVLNIKDESVLPTLKKVVKVNVYASAEDFFAKMLNKTGY